MRIIPSTLLFVSCFAAAGCDKLFGNDKGPLAPTGPPSPGSNIVYSALGASDVIGYGSSAPCLPFQDCNGNGYVWVAARQLRSQGFTVTVSSLGIPTAVISRVFQDIGSQNSRPAANIIDQEMPFVPREASVVTVFAGANEVNRITSALGLGEGGANPTAYIDQTVAAFGADYSTLLAGIRNRAPGARIIVLNVPNVAGMPFLSGATLQQKQAAQRAAVRMTTTVINAHVGVTVVDLMCDARFYQPSIFSTDGFHPNDAGYSLLGGEITRAVISASYPAPRNSCAQMVLY
jgi:lysophospholipase L1-like esterase